MSQLQSLLKPLQPTRVTPSERTKDPARGAAPSQSGGKADHAGTPISCLTLGKPLTSVKWGNFDLSQ